MPSHPRPVSCHCDDIREWGFRHISPGLWAGFNPLAQQLKRVHRKRWTIESVHELVDSDKAGCQTCILIRKSIQKYTSLRTVKEVKLDLSTAVPQLKVTVVSRLRTSNTESRVFYLAHPEGYKGYEPFGQGVLRPRQQPRLEALNINAEAAIHKINQWTRDCMEHKTCSSGVFIPTRLLSIGGGDRIRLIETWPRFNRPYIALSHCWGKSQHATTTRANYAQRKTSIATHELSKTFQDAIWLSRRLGLQYLWIDSLCIIQDDATDWDREAVTMHRLYGAAYLTLAASHGADGEAGLFPAGAAVKVHKSLKAPDGQLQRVHMVATRGPGVERESSIHKALTSYNADMARHCTETLLTRGWAFQERVLSARVVHFTSKELVWECQSKQSCECGVMKGNSLLTEMMGSVRYGDILSDDGSDTDNDSVESLHREKEEEREQDEKAKSYATLLDQGPAKAWEQFVGIYTTRALTKPADRLPAFAGFAQSFQKLVDILDPDFDTEFCAGLWMQSLPNSLMWSCSSGSLLAPCAEDDSAKRITDVRAPSWSWYSVTGACRFFTDSFNDHTSNARRVTLNRDFITAGVNVRYTFDSMANGSPFGRLKRGALVLENAATFIMVRDSPQERFGLLPPFGAIMRDFSELHLLLDDPADKDYTGELLCLCLAFGNHFVSVFGRCEVRPDYLLASTGFPLTDKEETLREFEFPYDMPHEGSDNAYKCDEHNFGLALVPVPGQPGTFQRIGLYHLEGVGCVGMGDFDRECVSRDDIPPPSGYLHDLLKCLTRDRIVTII